MNDSIEYKDDLLRINYADYGNENRNYDALFDFLGDFDIITASEIGNDVIIFDSDVFYFTKNDEQKLKENGFVLLQKVGFLANFINHDDDEQKSFYKWYMRFPETYLGKKSN
jgi:hypothetical protein